MPIEISIVIPTKNNAKMLERCLESIKNIDYPKDKYEVIIVDGYSKDNTVEIAKKYGCRVIFEDKGTISYARDLGVKHTKGEFIAFTDDDVVVDKNWLKNLRKHFTDEKIAAVGGPNLTSPDDTEFAQYVGIVLEFLSKPGARYALKENRVMEIYHNPTVNVMYRKKVLEEVRGFNYSLVTADDEELDHRIRQRGYKLLYTPDAIVWHYRKPTWKKFIKMAYTYGLGRMQAIKLHRDMARWFHFAPSLLLGILILLGVISLKYLLMVVGIGLTLLLCMSLYLAIKNKKNPIKGMIIIASLIAIWILFWGVGFIRGIFKQVEVKK